MKLLIHFLMSVFAVIYELAIRMVPIALGGYIAWKFQGEIDTKTAFIIIGVFFLIVVLLTMNGTNLEATKETEDE